MILAKSLLEKVDKQCGKLLNFKNLWIFAPVAQLDRVADFESEGCRFESCRARFDKASTANLHGSPMESLRTEIKHPAEDFPGIYYRRIYFALLGSPYGLQGKETVL